MYDIPPLCVGVGIVIVHSHARVGIYFVIPTPIPTQIVQSILGLVWAFSTIVHYVVGVGVGVSEL